MTTRVFVYGTLRRGDANHRLLEHATFVGPARTQSAYELRDLGSFPAAVEGGATSIVGEVYEVDGLTLGHLDRLEGHPRMYRREPVLLEGGEVANMYLWVGRLPVAAAVIASGDWIAHRREKRG